MLKACGTDIVQVELDGTLTILTPNYFYSPETMREDWVVVGDIENVAPRILIENTTPYLAIDGSAAPFAALRPINAKLLATPFLSWEWRVMDSFKHYAPLRLTIGFSDDVIQSGVWPIQRLWKPVIPEFSRSISIEWGHSALERGSLKIFKDVKTKRLLASYIARGGHENQGIWWQEAVDLSSLHAKAWPHLDMRNTAIVFAGFIVNKVQSKMSGHLRKLRLSR